MTLKTWLVCGLITLGFLFKPFTANDNKVPDLGDVIIIMVTWPLFVGYYAYCIMEYNNFIAVEKMDEMHKIEERSTDEPTDEMPILQNGLGNTCRIRSGIQLSKSGERMRFFFRCRSALGVFRPAPRQSFQPLRLRT